MGSGRDSMCKLSLNTSKPPHFDKNCGVRSFCGTNRAKSSLTTPGDVSFCPVRVYAALNESTGRAIMHREERYITQGANIRSAQAAGGDRKTFFRPPSPR